MVGTDTNYTKAAEEEQLVAKKLLQDLNKMAIE